MLPATLVTTFAALGVLHIYWLLGGRFGLAAALPEVEGRPAFLPSKGATLVVGAGLFACAGLVAALAGWATLPLRAGLLDLAGCALALVFLARAIGDFRLVGFFKRVRGTRFAALDSCLYSPLCLGLALGVFRVVWARRG